MLYKLHKFEIDKKKLHCTCFLVAYLTIVNFDLDISVHLFVPKYIAV